jgi:hypothetical protein
MEASGLQGGSCDDVAMGEQEVAGHLIDRFGSARHPERLVAHERPDGVGDDTVAAVGKLSEALEAVEHARGHLYAFHRFSGTADRMLADAVKALGDAGYESLARQVSQVLVGRDVVAGLWTFEIVEAYDEQYWSVFREVERIVRDATVGGEPHVFEAEMKQREQSEP